MPPDAKYCFVNNNKQFRKYNFIVIRGCLILNHGVSHVIHYSTVALQSCYAFNLAIIRSTPG